MPFPLLGLLTLVTKGKEESNRQLAEARNGCGKVTGDDLNNPNFISYCDYIIQRLLHKNI